MARKSPVSFPTAEATAFPSDAVVTTGRDVMTVYRVRVKVAGKVVYSSETDMQGWADPKRAKMYAQQMAEKRGLAFA